MGDLIDKLPTDKIVATEEEQESLLLLYGKKDTEAAGGKKEKEKEDPSAAAVVVATSSLRDEMVVVFLSMTLFILLSCEYTDKLLKGFLPNPLFRLGVRALIFSVILWIGINWRFIVGKKK